VFYGLFAGKFRDSSDSPGYPVVLAARALLPGTVLQADDLKTSSLQGKAAPKGAFSSPDQIIGFTVREAIGGDQMVMDTALASHRSIPPGMRAISIHVSDSTGIVQMLHPGNRVDVQVVTNPLKGETAIRTVLQNIQLLSVSTLDNGRPVANLLVQPEEADLLGLADSAAKVRLVLRNPSDDGRPTQGIIPVSDLIHITPKAAPSAAAAETKPARIASLKPASN
jgi:pilus assembly protein CpaB